MKRMLAAAAALALVVVLSPLVAGSSGARAVACSRPSSFDLAVGLRRRAPVFRRALIVTFGPRWVEAAIISFGESRWTPDAQNGQYLGYFQMGAHERAVTGWTADAAGQVAAAKRLNDMTGGTWAPWDCRP